MPFPSHHFSSLKSSLTLSIVDDDGCMEHDGMNDVDESMYITYAPRQSSDTTTQTVASSAASTVHNNNSTSSSWYPYMNNETEATSTAATTANKKHSIVSSYGRREKQYLCMGIGGISNGQGGPFSGETNGLGQGPAQGLGGQGMSGCCTNHPAQLLLIEQLRRVRRQLHGAFLAGIDTPYDIPSEIPSDTVDTPFDTSSDAIYSFTDIL